MKDSVQHPLTGPPPVGPPPVPARTAPVITNTNNLQHQTRIAPPPPPSRSNAHPPPPPPVQQPVAPGPPPPPPPTRTPVPKQDIHPAPGVYHFRYIRELFHTLKQFKLGKGQYCFLSIPLRNKKKM